MLVRHRAAVAFAGAALFVGTAYAVVTSDAFVRRMVRSVISRTFRGPAHVDDARFSFLEGLVVRGLEVRDPADPVGPAAVRVAELRADFGLFLFGEGPRVTAVTLEGPEVRVRRGDDGTLSVARLLEPVEAAAEPARRPPDVTIHGGTVIYEDPALVDGGAVTLTDVEMQLAPSGDAWKCDVAGASQVLGPLSGTAFVTPDGGVTAHLDLPALPVAAATLRRLRLDAAARAADLGAHGTLGVHAEVAWVAGAQPAVRAKVNLAGLATTLRMTDAPDAAPVEVTVTRGRAELDGGAVVLTDLEVRALDAVATCARAELTGLEAGGAPALRADVDVTHLVLDDALAARLPAGVRHAIDAYAVRGTIAAHASVRGPLASPEIEGEATVTDARVRYDGYLRDDGTRHGFPWEVRDVAGTVSLRGSLVELTAVGRHGDTSVYAHGVLDYTSGDELPDVTIVAEDVPLDGDLRAAFGDRAEKVFDRWRPGGRAARIDVRVVRDPHADGPFGEATEVTIHLDGRATMRPRLLPLDLAELRGRIQVLYPSRGARRFERVRLIGVRATAPGLALRVDGRVETDREAGTDDLVVEADVDDLAGPLREALLASEEFVPESVKRLVGDLGPAGRAEIRAEVAGDPDRRRDRVVAVLRGASVRGYRDVPFAATGVTGTVVVDGDEVRLDGISADALGTRIRGGGRLTGIASGAVEPDVVIECADLPLGPPLRRALGPLGEKAKAFWDHLAPSGEIGEDGTRAAATVVLRASNDATPVEIHLTKVRGPLRPAGLPMVLEHGALDYDGREATLSADARLNDAWVTLRSARVDLRTGVVDVDADVTDLRFPEDLVPLLSEETAAGISARAPDRNLDASAIRARYDPSAERLDLAGEVTFTARSEEPDPTDGEAPDLGLAPEGTATVDRVTFWFPPGLPVAFDGSFVMRGFRVKPGLQVDGLTGRVALAGSVDADGTELVASAENARLRVEGYPLQDAKIDLASGFRGVRVDAAGTLHGGKFTARVGPGKTPAGFQGEMHLRGADLSRFAKSGDVKGTLAGDVVFRNPTGESPDLRGSVEATVADGDLVRFPVLSAILNVIPGAGNLTDAALSAQLEGRTVRVRDLAVRGPILSLTKGKGTVSFDGAVELTMDAGIPLTSIVVRGTVREPDASLRLLSSAP